MVILLCTTVGVEIYWLNALASTARALHQHRIQLFTLLSYFLTLLSFQRFATIEYSFSRTALYVGFVILTAWILSCRNRLVVQTAAHFWIVGPHAWFPSTRVRLLFGNRCILFFSSGRTAWNLNPIPNTVNMWVVAMPTSLLSMTRRSEPAQHKKNCGDSTNNGSTTNTNSIGTDANLGTDTNTQNAQPRVHCFRL